MKARPEKDNSAKNELPVLVTGGAGFIGANVASKVLSTGRRVIVFDNLSRPGVELNAAWLTSKYGDLVEIVRGDIRDRAAVKSVVERVGQVFHFAAQVAVTTSLVTPTEDFEINAGGTLNVLEAIRTSVNRPSLLFTSTNKVYGGLEDLTFRQRGDRYEPVSPDIRGDGISEERPLDFHSPYGCSKGAADQYVIDYARSFGLSTVVFRMSCIYGPRQFGTEDQGWVAHFLIKALKNEPITLYGDGRQVRDILYIDDLVRAMLLAQDRASELAGQAFNIGGGVDNTISLLNLLDIITGLTGQAPKITADEWRVGDQRYYVSDTRKFGAATGWKPTVDAQRGIENLYRWLCEQYGMESKPTARESAAKIVG
jgi:CDP-paratose 2-epimerase